MTNNDKIRKIMPSLLISLFTSSDQNSISLAYVLGDEKQKELMRYWYHTAEAEAGCLEVAYIFDSDIMDEVLDSDRTISTFDDIKTFWTKSKEK